MVRGWLGSVCRKHGCSVNLVVNPGAVTARPLPTVVPTAGNPNSFHGHHNSSLSLSTPGSFLSLPQGLCTCYFLCEECSFADMEFFHSGGEAGFMQMQMSQSWEACNPLCLTCYPPTFYILSWCIFSFLSN